MAMTTKKVFKPPIKKVADIDRPRSWAIYGRSGAGKTTFAGTFPAPILLLDIKDKGTDSVKDVKNLDVWEIEEWDDLEDVYEFLESSQNKYKTVVFDTITQLQDMCLVWVLSKKRKSTKRAGDWGTMSRQDWGTASASMKEKITTFRNLDMEVVFIAQEKATMTAEEADDVDHSQLLVPEVGPSAMKSVAAHLNACVSIIGHSFVRMRRFKETVKGRRVDMEEEVYCLRIGASPIYTTKARKPKGVEIPAYIEDPTYKDVLDAMEGR